MCLCIQYVCQNENQTLEDNGAVVLKKHPGSTAAINHQRGSSQCAASARETSGHTHTHTNTNSDYSKLCKSDLPCRNSCMFKRACFEGPKHSHHNILSGKLPIQFGEAIKNSTKKNNYGKHLLVA